MQIELLDRRAWATRAELAKAIFEWIEAFYNRADATQRSNIEAPTSSKPFTPRPESRHDQRKETVRKTWDRSATPDNALNYRRSIDFKAVIEALEATCILIRPHSPWQNGKVERFSRTMQEGCAYRQIFTSNSQRADALAPWLNHYNYDRPHTAYGCKPPIRRVTPTC